MKRVAAAVQVVVVLAIIGFSTWELFCGNLAAAVSSFPVLLAFYYFVVVMNRRSR